MTKTQQAWNEGIHYVAALFMGILPAFIGFALARGWFLEPTALPGGTRARVLFVAISLTFVLLGSIILAGRWYVVSEGQCGGCRRIKIKGSPWH